MINQGMRSPPIGFWTIVEILAHEIAHLFGVGVTTSAGNLTIVFRGQAGTDSWIPAWNQYRVYLGSSVADGDWHRIERDLAEIVPRLTPGVTLTNIDYVQFGVVSSYPCWVDDIRFSNSMTVEKNVLAGGSIGHTIRNRTINPSTYAATDRWPVPP